jgi:transglycosylase-like protein with SLT domain
MTNWYAVGRRAANKYNIPWPLFRAMINQESGWNPNARSGAGAIGFSQLMPGTAAGMGVNPYNPRANLFGGARYLANQYGAFHNWRLALSAYNSGPGGSERSGRVEGIPETQAYVKAIMGAWGGPNRTGPGGMFAPQGTGSFYAPDPASIEQAHRKQAALSMLGGVSSFPGLVGGPQGLNPVLSAAVGKKIGQNIGMKKYSFNYDLGAGGPGGRNLQGAKLMLAVIKLARARGFQVGENPYTGGAAPGVHTQHSFHYQNFPGMYGGRHLGRAVDINWQAGRGENEAAHLLGLFRLIRQRFGFKKFQELLLPGRTYFAGGGLNMSTYPGHYDHFHLAI